MKAYNRTHKDSDTGCLLVFIAIIVMAVISISTVDNVKNIITRDTLRIISSTDNMDLEDVVKDYAKDNNLNVEIEYAGTLEIMEKLNAGEKYDAVWASNSMWLYMLEGVKTNDSKIINMNPVVFGIRKQKAEELGFVGKAVRLEDILNAIKEGKLEFAMTSATQTNTGACAYLGFLSVLAGNPEVLTRDYLDNEGIKNELKELFKGVNRTSGSEEYLKEMYMNGECDALVTYETEIIHMNLEAENDKDTLYAIYTEDGVSMSDSVFAYLGETNTELEEAFLGLQSYLLSEEGQQKLMATGRRVWYGGVKADVDKKVFNPEWGIDTTKYITPIKFPSSSVIREALGLYQSELRKPTHVIFALDYSGSMSGDGKKQLVKAMDFILTEEKASQNFLQFSDKDKVSVIFFSNEPSEIYTIKNGTDTENLLTKIEDEPAMGGTNIYDTVTKAVKELDGEDVSTYNVSVVLMTDGSNNRGSEYTMKQTIADAENTIPVYTILFGSAEKYEMERIATLTHGKVFDGRTNLLNAFKEVRGYN